MKPESMRVVAEAQAAERAQEEQARKKRRTHRLVTLGVLAFALGACLFMAYVLATSWHTRARQHQHQQAEDALRRAQEALGER